MAKRAEHVLLNSPFPGDKRYAVTDVHENRFNLPPINLEVLSRCQRAPTGINFEKSLDRGTLCNPDSVAPDIYHYQGPALEQAQEEQVAPSNRRVGSMPFEK